MRNALIVPVLLSISLCAACTARTGGTDPQAPESEDAFVSSRASWKPLMDDCVQAAVGAAADKAFDDNNLQHLKGITVDGDLAMDSDLTVKVTTGNDEDGDTTRVVKVKQTVNTMTGRITCDVQKIDGKTPGDTHRAGAALTGVVDQCTGVAIIAAQKISDNYWHLYGLSLDDGDPADTGTLDYTVTGGNDEDGNTDYKITVKQTIDRRTGKETCKVTSAKSTRE